LLGYGTILAELTSEKSLIRRFFFQAVGANHWRESLQLRRGLRVALLLQD